MDLTKDDLQEYMRLWSEEFHETISAEDAQLSASSVLELYALLVSEEEDS
jgi:hypothetical protein